MQPQYLTLKQYRRVIQQKAHWGTWTISKTDTFTSYSNYTHNATDDRRVNRAYIGIQVSELNKSQYII